MGKLSLEVDHTANPEISDTTEESFFKPLSILIIKQQKVSNELSAIAEKVRLDPKANRYPNIVNRNTQLSEECDKNQRLINTEIKKIEANNKFANELRRLAQWHLQLLDKQQKLAQELCEEKINEEQAERLKSEINKELFWLCSEPVSGLYKSDFQNILTNGISKADLPYLGKLSQLDEEIRNTAEDKIADYYMQAAEEQIAKNSEKGSQSVNALMEKNSTNNPSLDFEIAFDANSLPALFTADSVDRINELVLNGADPIKESKGLSITPLAQQFASKYVIDQELNGVNIHAKNVRAQLKCHPSKELKVQLKNQAEQFSIDAKELKFSLKNNEALTQAHIKAIVLKDPSAEAAHYPDISHSEKFQSLWNDCKQEVEKMQQTQLTVSCTAYDFLNKGLEKLPDLSSKTLKPLVVQFPHYAPLLQMQSNMLDNYRLVQGPRQVTTTSEVSLANTSNNGVKDMSVSESKISEKQAMPFIIETFDKNCQSVQQFNQNPLGFRLNSSAFFGGNWKSESESKSVLKKTSEKIPPRFNSSVFFANIDNKSESSSLVRKDQLREKLVMLSNLKNK